MGQFAEGYRESLKPVGEVPDWDLGNEAMMYQTIIEMEGRPPFSWVRKRFGAVKAEMRLRMATDKHVPPVEISTGDEAVQE